MESIKCLIIEIAKGCHMKMELIRHTIRARETYEVKIESSLLWECALGIAAVTNTRLISHLEKPIEEWNDIKKIIKRAPKRIRNRSKEQHMEGIATIITSKGI